MRNKIQFIHTTSIKLQTQSYLKVRPDNATEKNRHTPDLFMKARPYNAMKKKPFNLAFEREASISKIHHNWTLWFEILQLPQKPESDNNWCHCRFCEDRFWLCNSNSWLKCIPTIYVRHLITV